VLILNHGRVAAEGTVAEVSRQAAAPRSARLRVPADAVPDALRVLASVRGVRAAEPADGQPGTLALGFEENQASGPANDALCALADAGVSVLFFELEGARLSDAFLAMTEAA
jgi:ABC-2 type transport system ATP-binding protein